MRTRCVAPVAMSVTTSTGRRWPMSKPPGSRMTLTRASQVPPARIPSGLEFHRTYTGAFEFLATALAGSRSARTRGARTRGARTRRMPLVHVVVPIGSQPLEQPVHQRCLRRVELLARLVGREPARAVDLRELLAAPGARRPLQRERVAAHRLGVEVSLGRPRRHPLAVLLAHLAEIEQLARGRAAAGLLLELAQRARARVLVAVVLALGDRPRPRVLARPERPARVHDQHLDAGGATAVEQDARAALHGPAVWQGAGMAGPLAWPPDGGRPVRARDAARGRAREPPAGRDDRPARRAVDVRAALDGHVPAGAPRADAGSVRAGVGGAAHDHDVHGRAGRRTAGGRAAERRTRAPPSAARGAVRLRGRVGAVLAGAEHMVAARAAARAGPRGRGGDRDRAGGGPRQLRRGVGRPRVFAADAGVGPGADP